MPTITELLDDTLRRESDRGKIAGKLRDVADATVDVIASSGDLTFVEAAADLSAAFLHSPADQPMILPDGVANTVPVVVTRTAIRSVAERVDMPIRYVDRLVGAGHADLAAQHFNALSQREPRTATFRLLHGSDGYALRVVRSARYEAIDNIDLLNATVEGLRSGNVGLDDCEVDADWTGDRFRLRIAVPGIEALAPDVLGDWRPPYSMSPARGVHDRFGVDEAPPAALWAGLEVSNSETGQGRMVIVPRIVVPWCRNGATMTRDMVAKTHLGGEKESGVVTWSDETRRRSIELVTSQVADAVRQFCSVEYLRRAIESMREAKGTPASPTHGVEVVTKRCGLSDAEAANVLDAFATSGDFTVHGLAQSVTVAAQHADNGDRQSELEAAFFDIVSHAGLFADAKAGA